MSRSYKKTPGWTDTHGARKCFKRLANKKIRRAKLTDEFGDRGDARRFTGHLTYSICDYTFLYYNKYQQMKYTEEWKIDRLWHDPPYRMWMK